MNIVMTGFVTDNQDPDNLGRVKIKMYLSEVETESNWLPIVAGFAGDDKGIYCLPDIDDFVLAVFIDNTYQKGYILGSTWTQDSPLPTSEENSDADLNGDGNNALRMIRTKAGQRIILDDTDGSEKIQILNADATSRIELDAENELINLETEQGISLSAKTAVSITAEELSVELDKDLTVSCKNLGFETSGDSSIKGDGGIALEGKGISLN